MDWQHIVITGGAGFVGVNLARAFLEKGNRVTLLDLTDKGGRLPSLLREYEGRVAFKCIDLAGESCDLPVDADLVIHLAAFPHVDYSYFYPHKVIRNNIGSLVGVLDDCIRKNIPVLYASSVEVYGGDGRCVYEESDRLNPQSPYAASKLAGESILETYRECYGLHYIIFRLTNLYGPWQLPDRIIPRLITRSLLNLQTEINGDVVRDYVYIGDAVEAIYLLSAEECWGETYNISSGGGISVKDLVSVLFQDEGMNKIERPILSPQIDSRRGRGSCLISDNQKVKEKTGWVPATSLPEGAEKTFSWYRRNEQWWACYIKNIRSDRSADDFIIDTLFHGCGTRLKSNNVEKCHG